MDTVALSLLLLNAAALAWLTYRGATTPEATNPRTVLVGGGGALR